MTPLFYSTSEALEVARERGIGAAKAKADILRGFRDGARQVDGQWIGMRVKFIGRYKVVAREWRADPQVDFKASTLWAKVTEPPWAAPFSAQVKFLIPRESVDWLWPEPQTAAAPAPPRRTGRPSIHKDSIDKARQVLAMVGVGDAPNNRQAILMLAGKRSGNELTNFVKRVEKTLREIGAGSLDNLDDNSGA